MSDTSTNKFNAQGDNAARAAFTPSPGTPTPTPEQGYTFWDTDDQVLYAWETGTGWVATGGSGGNVNAGATLTQYAVVLGDGSTDVAVVAGLGSSGDVLTSNGAGVAPTFQTPSGGSGAVVQVVNTQTGAAATGTTTIPIDDTIPQNTEGDEYMTLSVTPTSATNKLRIDVTCVVSSSATGQWMTTGLFQDSSANAVAATTEYVATGTATTVMTFSHYMTAGTTSATTFKVRAGGASGGTTTFNGNIGARLLGGVMASSITIAEIVP